MTSGTHPLTTWVRADVLPELAADRMAVAIGLHPLLVWGDAWLEVGAELPGSSAVPGSLSFA